MGAGDLFWVFFIVMALQPALKQRLLEAQRLKRLRALEKKRGSRVILLIHRQESMGLLGFPIFRYVSIEDSEEVLRAIRLTDPKVPIDLVLHTPGGLVLAAEQIARALAAHEAKVTVFVPHYAMSGGTLIALAADEIVMDPYAVLGPVDPQLGSRPAASILEVVRIKSPALVDDQTLIEADIAGKALRQVHGFVMELLAERMPESQARHVADVLSTGVFTHDYPIGVEEARALGLPVSTDIPDEVHDLMALYPQPQARRPSVQYLPLPYGDRPNRLPDRNGSDRG